MLGIEPLRAALEFARMHFMRHEQHATGDGHAVVLFPGLGTDHRYMAPLTKHCERLGYECHDWGRGRNTGPVGDPDAWLADLAAEVSAIADRQDDGVSLIGWSLGGLYAREIAKALPGRVRHVITLGSPFARISNSTNVGWLYGLLNRRSTAIDSRLAKRLRTPPPVPTTSVYSRSDGIVAWQACVAGRGPQTENIEVESSHLGLVWHPEVLDIVSDRLAQPRGNWRPWSQSTITMKRAPASDLAA
ncbi:MAG: alpha/beta fold hydrolase [Betaproteobacteria bacterium]